MARRVVEVTPNVTGQIIAIPVKSNVPEKAGDVLFQIDRAPFQYKVAQLKASLAAARQQAEILKPNYQQAAATAAGLTARHRNGGCNLLWLRWVGTLFGRIPQSAWRKSLADATSCCSRQSFYGQLC